MIAGGLFQRDLASLWVRTTIEFPDPIFREAKALAATQGSSLKEFVLRAIEKEVARLRQNERRRFSVQLEGPGLLRRNQRQDLRRDWRVTFATEPAGVETGWIHLMSATPAPPSWTDAYLAAFASGHGYGLVSFDRDFARWKDLRFRRLLLVG